MRGLVVLATAGSLAACTPEITSGAYDCGDEGSCPTGFACDGVDNTCVAAGAARPFTCDSSEVHEPDDDFAHAFAVEPGGCISTVIVHGCLASGDTADWISLTTPTGCAALSIHTRTIAPIAFEPVAVSVVDAAGNVLATDSTCSDALPPAKSGSDANCSTTTVDQGAAYGIRVTPAGGGDCDGECAFNRYYVTIDLAVP